MSRLSTTPQPEEEVEFFPCPWRKRQNQAGMAPGVRLCRPSGERVQVRDGASDAPPAGHEAKALRAEATRPGKS